MLHGWPGFWFDWRRVVPLVEPWFDVIAPDFRGFGDSDRPPATPGTYGPRASAADMISLLDSLNLGDVTVVGHDIGATVAQTIARSNPERVKRLILLNPPYPGIAERRYEPNAQREFWYQHLHDLPLFDGLVARDRLSVAVYLKHFYEHWICRRESLKEEDLERIIDMYSRPGAMLASIAYYRARSADKAANATIPQLISQPTHVIWGERDPVIPARWSDRLDQFFCDFTLTLVPGVGHFPALEAPELVAEAIRGSSLS